MNKVGLIAVICGVLIFIGLAVGITVQGNKIVKLQRELAYANNNYSALDEENSELKTTKKNLMLTIDQLDNAKDSLVKEMNNVRKQLKIKDKEIERLTYIGSIAQKIDTLYFRDTLFKKDVHIDTTIVDNPWYECNIKLDYPGSIVVSPKFESEKYIITSLKKEIPNPAKCKLFRVFQKKVNVIETEVVEKNPYITNNRTKFLEIIK